MFTCNHLIASSLSRPFAIDPGDPWPNARRCDATQVTALRPVKKLRRDSGVFQGVPPQCLVFWLLSTEGWGGNKQRFMNWQSTFDRSGILRVGTVSDQDAVKLLNGVIGLCEFEHDSPLYHLLRNNTCINHVLTVFTFLRPKTRSRAKAAPW